jgi:hypothetical protein
MHFLCSGHSLCHESPLRLAGPSLPDKTLVFQTRPMRNFWNTHLHGCVLSSKPRGFVLAKFSLVFPYVPLFSVVHFPICSHIIFSQVFLYFLIVSYIHFFPHFPWNGTHPPFWTEPRGRGVTLQAARAVAVGQKLGTVKLAKAWLLICIIL